MSDAVHPGVLEAQNAVGFNLPSMLIGKLPELQDKPKLLLPKPPNSMLCEQKQQKSKDVVHSHPTTASVSGAAVPTTPSSSNKNHTCHEQVIQAHQFQNAPFC